MVLLSIGFSSGECDVYDRLNELVNYFKEKGITVGLVESDSGEMHFIKCVVKDEYDSNSSSEIKESFNIFAANAIYQIIVDNFQINIINKILKENYSFFKSEEMADILRKCMDILEGMAPISSSEYLYYINRKDKIIKKIVNYISDNTDLIIEGFLRFRLKEFYSEVEDIVDKVVEEYLIEREYNEFIKLLKYFVEIQESSIDIVNIVIDNEGNYFMYDSNGCEITESFLKDLMNESISGEINCDDLLVSSLITAAPKLIIIHNLPNVKNKEIIDTIKSVFSDRVKICSGCNLCVDKSPAHKV